VTSYESAGVSLAKAEEVVERLRSAVASTRTPEVTGAFGAFAGLFAVDEERLLAATTDSVGTKLILSRRAGRLFDSGIDLAAHCINDVLTTGAEPLFFLDYAAAATLDLEDVAELVEGAASVCRAAECAILGGETAELPGIYRAGELDFAGTCVGLVRRADLIDGSRCEAGDVVLGLPSAGLHANGFTLVRSLLGAEEPDPDLLLAPTRLYLDDVRSLRRRCDVRALAHVTGGGIPGNLPRVLPPGLGARIDPGAWERPPVYGWLDERGVPEEEQRRVFNLGVGMCAVVPERAAGAAGFPVVGRLEEGDSGVVWDEGFLS
jgi:phosphoribosylformylglycinamidine cyclo-ligase